MEGFLSGIEGVPCKQTLVRCVPQLHFQGGEPPSYLFTTGERNRINPAGVHCIYFSEDEDTANAEYRLQWSDTQAEHQPKLTFFAELCAAAILDLALPGLRECLNLADEDFFDAWRLKKGTRLQEIGAWISAQQRITAVRFPSNAARREGGEGWNWVVFRAALQSPDSLKIFGEAGTLEEWPATKANRLPQ